MFFRENKAILLSLFFVLSFVVSAAAQQNKSTEGSPVQRLEVLRQRLDSLKRSVGGAVSAFKDDGGKNDKSKKDDKSSL